MKGKVIVMMKRWWLTALVFTLALSLTSCSKKKTEVLQADYGFTQCDGTIGSFDVYVIRSKSDPALFEVSIMPVQVDASGDIASVTIANRQPAYRQLISQVVLNSQQEINAGTISASDLQLYDILAITPYDPSSNFVAQTPVKSAFCSLPMPGDGVPTNQQSSQQY